ncbi:MAG: hypothetical protein ABW174_01965 [Flavitalea sp.]
MKQNIEINRLFLVLTLVTIMILISALAANAQGGPLTNAAVTRNNLSMTSNTDYNSTAKISGVSGIAENGNNAITWTTVMEDNTKQFEVEYSYDNKDYQRAGIVNADNKSEYIFNHVTAVKPSTFYRLKVLGTNGATFYTKPIEVKNGLAKSEDRVAPTVIRDNVLNMTITNNYRNLQVFNSVGDEVYRENLAERTGNRVSFTLPTLPSGPYYVRLVGTTKSVTKQFMISH